MFSSSIKVPTLFGKPKSLPRIEVLNWNSLSNEKKLLTMAQSGNPNTKRERCGHRKDQTRASLDPFRENPESSNSMPSIWNSSWNCLVSKGLVASPLLSIPASATPTASCLVWLHYMLQPSLAADPGSSI